MQSRQRYTQRHYAVGGTLQPSNRAPSIVSVKVKGVSHSVFPITLERFQPTSDACSRGLDR